MKLNSKILISALMASAVGLVAIPTFASADDGMRGQNRQMAFRGQDRGDDCRGGPMGHGKRMGGRHDGPRGFAGGPRGGMGAFLIERFDVNEDGTITAAEIATVNAERVANYDADGNEALSLAEFKVLWADTMNERMVRAFQRLDPDGDASVTLEEYGDRFDKMLARLDRDGNDAIDADELRGPRGGPGGPGGKGPRPGNGPGPDVDDDFDGD